MFISKTLQSKVSSFLNTTRKERKGRNIRKCPYVSMDKKTERIREVPRFYYFSYPQTFTDFK